VFQNPLRLYLKPDNPLKNDLSGLHYNECKNNRYMKIKFLPENGDAWAFLD